MSKKLNTKYLDFIKDSLFINHSLGQIIELLPNKGPIESLLLFLINFDVNNLYPTDSTINYISLSDTINMLKYPAKNKINKNNYDDNFEITPQIEMRIGRITKSILRAIDKSRLSININTNAIIEGDSILLDKSFNDFYYSNSSIFEFPEDEYNLSTFVTIKKDDNEIANLKIKDATSHIWSSSSIDDRNFKPSFTIKLADNIGLSGKQHLLLSFEIKFSGKTFKEINDSDVESFVNNIIAFIKINSAPEGSKIEEVFGEEIKKWYDSKNYQSASGQLGTSCMSSSEKNKFFDIYIKNTKQISLLILKNENDKLIGRSLLWKLDDGNKFMDRVYCLTDYDVKIFEKYAIDNGFIYRNSSGNSKLSYFVNGQKLEEKPELVVTIEKYDFPYYPYIDTLCYLNKSDSTLTNLKENDYDIELRDVDGKWSEYYD